MRKHRTDTVSLSFSILFFAVIGLWLTATIADTTLPLVGWFFTLGLIIFGVIGLLVTWRIGRRGDTHEPPSPAIDGQASP